MSGRPPIPTIERSKYIKDEVEIFHRTRVAGRLAYERQRNLAAAVRSSIPTEKDKLQRMRKVSNTSSESDTEYDTTELNTTTNEDNIIKGIGETKTQTWKEQRLGGDMHNNINKTNIKKVNNTIDILENKELNNTINEMQYEEEINEVKPTHRRRELRKKQLEKGEDEDTSTDKDANTNIDKDEKRLQKNKDIKEETVNIKEGIITNVELQKPKDLEIATSETIEMYTGIDSSDDDENTLTFRDKDERKYHFQKTQEQIDQYKIELEKKKQQDKEQKKLQAREQVIECVEMKKKIEKAKSESIDISANTSDNLPDDEDYTDEDEIEQFLWKQREFKRFRRYIDERIKIEQEESKKELLASMDHKQREEYLKSLQQQRLELLRNTCDPFLIHQVCIFYTIMRYYYLYIYFFLLFTNIQKNKQQKDKKPQQRVERQSGFHRGAFFVDETNDDNLFDRDFSQATGLDALYQNVDKSSLPEFMKVCI